jgi:metal-responsive CopG/Arc/MetJ family transcriptional regulator
MTTARKVKISISIDPFLLGAVDRYAARAGVTRSAALERWLAQVSHKEKLSRLEEETAAYYDALTETERQDDATWAAAASKSGARLRIDEPAAQPPPSAAKRRSARRKG